MMQRSTVFLLTVATALLASAADALPQAGGVAGGRATTVRTRCPRASCATSGDSALRARQEQLLLRIDSLRWQYEHVRLTDAERDRVSGEIARAVLVLQSSFEESPRASAAVTTSVAVEAARAPAVAGPRFAIAMATGCLTPGYLGVTFDGLSEEDCRNNERFIRFFKYPRIALVAASSPAERAGILQGDTLLALAGTDVTENEISLSKLLVPDTRVMVRVQRDGESKDLSVTILRAPPYYVLRSAPFPARAQETPQYRVRVAPQEAPMVPMPAMPVPRASFGWSSRDVLAGARVETITEGLGKALGAKEGVLIISVVPGSPAYDSGLRDGDVIQKADGRTVITVGALRSVLSRAEGAEGIKLVVIRERKSRDVRLRW